MLSIDPLLIKKVTPIFTGAFSVKDPHNVTDIRLDFQDDGHRFESGTMNFLAFYGLLTAFSECSPKATAEIFKRTKQLRHSLAFRGFRLLGSEKTENQSGIVVFTHDTIDVKSLSDSLTAKGVISTFRENSIRLAPGRGTTAEEIENFCEILDSLI